MNIDGAHLRDWTAQILQAWGHRAEDAVYLAETLVDANLRGVDSHGVMRLPIYRARIDAKLVKPRAVPSVHRNGATVRIDANGAPGQLAARTAVGEIDRHSTDHGIASAAVRGSTHFGAAGFYARELARRGKLAVVVSNSEPIVVPFGGREPLLGTNPFAFAAPTKGDPVSLDMATSTSAMGKVLVAQAKGAEIPSDWGVDATGVPTTDPDAVTALLPAGGPKGYGLGFLIEILGGVLSGASIAGDIGNMYTDFSKPQDVGHWMMAVDVAHFLPIESFVERIDGLVSEAHNTAPAPGYSRVLTPGEPEEVTRRRRAAEGIDLPEAVITELVNLGRDAETNFPGGTA